jgi:hypothetical protein
LAPSAGVEPTNLTFVASGPYPRARRLSVVAQCGLEPQSSAYEAPAFTHVLQRLELVAEVRLALTFIGL